jgi:hypothetical protein
MFLLPIWSRAVLDKLIHSYWDCQGSHCFYRIGRLNTFFFSQQPITENYPELDESSPHPSTLLTMHLFFALSWKSALTGCGNFTRHLLRYSPLYWKHRPLLGRKTLSCMLTCVCPLCTVIPCHIIKRKEKQGLLGGTNSLWCDTGRTEIKKKN